MMQQNNSTVLGKDDLLVDEDVDVSIYQDKKKAIITREPCLYNLLPNMPLS